MYSELEHSTHKVLDASSTTPRLHTMSNTQRFQKSKLKVSNQFVLNLLTSVVY